jgi:hypothetical protein
MVRPNDVFQRGTGNMADFVGGFQNRAHLMLRWNAKIEQTRRIPDTRNDTIAVSRIESR